MRVEVWEGFQGYREDGAPGPSSLKQGRGKRQQRRPSEHLGPMGWGPKAEGGAGLEPVPEGGWRQPWVKLPGPLSEGPCVSCSLFKKAGA